VRVLIFKNMKQIQVLLSLLLLSFNLTVHAEGLTLSERFKAAELIEVSDTYTAFPLYQELADQGHTDAKVRLAALLLRGLGGEGTKEEKFQQSLKLLNDAADKGNIKAYYALSVMYHDSASLTPNAELGMSWLIKAADAGEPRAQSQLGSLYLHGIFIKKDIEKSIFWYEKAISNGSNSARYNLAKIYINKVNITPQRLEKAISLYSTAAEQGDDDAKTALGNIYMYDTYGLKDGKKAFYWLNAAASNGNTFGQTSLASCYRYGIGTDINSEKAIY